MSHNYGTDIYSFLSVPRTYHEIVSQEWGINKKKITDTLIKMEFDELIRTSKNWHFQNDTFKRFKFYYQSDSPSPLEVVSIPYADLLTDWVSTSDILSQIPLSGAMSREKERNKINKRIKVMIELDVLEVKKILNSSSNGYARRGYAKEVRYYRSKGFMARDLENVLSKLKTNSSRVGSEGWRRLARWNIERGDK